MLGIGLGKLFLLVLLNRALGRFLPAAALSTILSAPVNAQSVEGLVLTVAFERTPESQAQRALHIFLRQIESVLFVPSITENESDERLLPAAHQLIERKIVASF